MPKIALVDDEQSILTSVSLSLQSEGFTVDTFLNGVEASTPLRNVSTVNPSLCRERDTDVRIDCSSSTNAIFGILLFINNLWQI